MRKLFAILVLVVGCGGGSGGVDRPTVSTTTKLSDLSSEQAGDVCDYVNETEGGEGYSKDCGDGIKLTVKTHAACVTSFDGLPASCTATVGDAEACADAVEDDLCKLLSAPACAWAIQCAGDDAPPGVQ